MTINEIKEFNKNPSKNLYKFYLDKYFEYNKCIDCGDVIYFSNSSFRNSKNGTILINKSYLSKKILYDKTYFLSICEDCLKLKYPEYENMNKSRIFNRICDITCYAFNIPIEISEKWKSDNYAMTLDNFIKKHGEILGKQKWESYCKKQSETNKFEYKNKKYGWSEKEFNDYNKSRSVTLYNLINKYGESDGIKIWDEYINKQKLTKSKEYVIDKYGKSYWEELCSRKSNSLKNIINRNGKKEGTILYKNIFNNITVYPPSKSSQLFFEKIDLILSKEYETYFYNKNEEYCIFDDELGFIFIDYYIKDINLSIEFNGDIWHANPSKYGENDIIPILNIKAKDIWNKDQKRYDILKNKHNINTIVIWESNKPDINNIIKTIKNNE